MVMIWCINGKALIYNNWEDSKTLFFPSFFPWACEQISLKFVENLSTRAPKMFDSPAPYHPFRRYISIPVINVRDVHYRKPGVTRHFII